jgi:hypothetical protein
MGEKKNKTQNFLQIHPKCIFCGGNINAQSIEHCPPRALFQHRHAPEGFEFPACNSCNNNTSDDDLIISVITRMCSPKFGDSDGKLIGMMKKLNRQIPNFYKKFLPNPIEARKNNRDLGITPKPGMTHQEMGVVNVTDEMRSAIEIFSNKLAKGILYHHENLILSNESCLALNWFTNANVIRDGRHIVFDILKSIEGQAPELSRSKSNLNEQFQYKFSISEDKEFFLIQAMFGEAFGLAIFGCRKQGYLENLLGTINSGLSEQYNPFKIIQGIK